MATGARGEAVIDVGGERYAVLFTNRALAEAEGLTGKTITQLLDRAAIGMEDLATLLLTGLEAARRDTDPRRARYMMEDAWSILDRVGFLAVMRTVTEGIVAVLTYSAEQEQRSDPPA